MNDQTRQKPTILILGAAGAVGRLIAQVAPAGSRIIGADWSEGPLVSLQLDVTSSGENVGSLHLACSQADIVVVALPEPVGLMAVRKLRPHLSAKTLIIDTFSVKGRASQEAAALGLRDIWVGVNPMFGPDLGIRGRPVAFVRYGDAPTSKAILATSVLQGFSRHGGRIISLDVEVHDRTCAVLQAAVHFTVLTFADFVTTTQCDPLLLDELATPLFEVFALAQARLLSGAPDTYWDIQTANPYAAEVRSELTAAASRVAATLTNSKSTSFLGLFDQLINETPNLAGKKVKAAQLFELLGVVR